ncbi:MAG TPA: CPBP family intramembrane glutamic endopeptidase [Terriglobales bacterium]|nr:CPBP family intramembrane glutamic endopeptidase [Terriglobales bacterium]
MSTIPSAPSEPSPSAVAPAWHTLVVLLVLFGLSASGGHSHKFAPLGRSHGHVASYLMVLVLEWLLVAFIWFGLRLRGLRMGQLVGGAWGRARAALRDLGLAIGFLVVANLVLAGVAALLKAKTPESVRGLLPHGRLETILYLLLALTAGICEEIIFRGYLQRQLSAACKSYAAGLVLQGIAFGAAHGYQGLKFMIVIAVYGCLFGLMAHWRRSLRPGIIAHFLQDGVLGLISAHYMK